MTTSAKTEKDKTEQGRSVVVRWRMLAERRLNYLVELYESGRWTVYYKEPDFLKAVQEARAALKSWEQLAPREASSDTVQNKPVEVSIVPADTTVILASPFNEIATVAPSADGVNA